MTGGATGLPFPPKISIAITIINIKNKKLNEILKIPPPTANAAFVLSAETAVVVCCTVAGAVTGAGEV